jgi:Peptidase C39 family
VTVSTVRIIVAIILLSSNSQAGPIEHDQLLQYCGVDAIYASSRILNTHVEYAQLVRPEFISTDAGSTDTDLAKAAEFAGLRTTRVDGLAIVDLNSLPTPAILHVRSNTQAKMPNHWTLLTRVEQGKAHFVDAGDWPAVMPLDQLKPFFEGSALVVSRADQPAPTFVSLNRVVYWTCIGLVGVSLLIGFSLAPAGGVKGFWSRSADGNRRWRGLLVLLARRRAGERVARERANA